MIKNACFARGRGILTAGALGLLMLAAVAQAGNENGRGPPTGKNNDNSNLPPEISGDPPAIAYHGQLYDFTPIATDPEGYSVKFYITGRPGWASFDGKTGRLWGTPGSADVGASYSVIIEAADRWNRTPLGPFTIAVQASDRTTVPRNTPPSISGVPLNEVTAGAAYAFTPTATDAEGDTLAFSIRNKPAWASFSSYTGTLHGTPSESAVGTYGNIEISVSDGTSLASLAPFAITVKDSANTPPVISGSPAASVNAGTTYTFMPSASDADGDTLSFSITNKPAWASFSASSGALTGTPPDNAAGVYGNIGIAVSDGAASAALAPFAIEVVAKPNTPPVISGTPPGAVAAGSSYSFRPSASDADGDTLGFSIRNKPTWASFSSATGALSGTPADGAAGTYGNVEISVSDGEATAALPAFTIEVLAPENGAPVISGTPARAVTANQPYSFTPQASDPDGDPLTFRVTNKPSWASFSTATGRLSGTPTSTHVGTHPDIVIGVSDGTANAALPAFSISVEQVSMGSVTLSWNPPTQNTDGSPLTDLTSYRVLYGQSSGNLNQQIELPNPGLTSAVIENLVSGTWYFAVKAVNSKAVESDLSGLATKSIP